MTRSVLLTILIGILLLLFTACDDAAPEGDAIVLDVAESEDGTMISEDDILLADRCTLCHGSERYETADYTMEEWLAVLDEMIARGAALSAEEKAVLAELLAK